MARAASGSAAAGGRRREGYTALRCLEPSCAWDAPQALQRGSRRQLSRLQAACAALAAGAAASGGGGQRRRHGRQGRQPRRMHLRWTSTANHTDMHSMSQEVAWLMVLASRCCGVKMRESGTATPSAFRHRCNPLQQCSQQAGSMHLWGLTEGTLVALPPYSGSEARALVRSHTRHISAC